MNIVADVGAYDEREPSAADLAAIEAEWPEIEADLAVLAAEIAEVLAESLGWEDPEDLYRVERLADALDEECLRVTPLTHYRSRRRATARLLAEIRDLWVAA